VVCLKKRLPIYGFVPSLRDIVIHLFTKLNVFNKHEPTTFLELELVTAVIKIVFLENLFPIFSSRRSYF